MSQLEFSLCLFFSLSHLSFGWSLPRFIINAEPASRFGVNDGRTDKAIGIDVCINIVNINFSYIIYLSLMAAVSAPVSEQGALTQQPSPAPSEFS